MFVSVLAFAVQPQSSFVTDRNVYSILSDNFTGAIQENGYDMDNIQFWSWADWSGGATAEPFSKNISDGTAKEGKNYLRVTGLKKGSGGAGGWSGCGYGFIHSYIDPETGGFAKNKENISHFKYLDFWIRKVEGNINELQVGIKDSANKVVSLSGKVNNSSTDWQRVTIDITTLSADLTNVEMPLLIICDNLTAKTVFDLDDVVLRTASSSADFKVTLKKVEDMTGAPENPTEISWLYYTGWQAAAQYIEIDADKYSSSFSIKIYVRHQGDGHDRGGLWAQDNSGEDHVVPMSYRVYNGYLKNVVESPVGDQSYLIGQSTAEGNNLYDRGVNPNSDPGWYPWIWMKEYNDIDFTKQSDIDSITVWDSVKGYHVAMPFFIDGDPNKPADGFDTLAGKIDRTLRVYLGAGFSSAPGGIEYTATVVVDVDYE